MDIEHVNKEIVENYGKMRTRMGVLALVFPVVVVMAGCVWGISPKPTLSDYYFAQPSIKDRVDHYPVRLWFCGVLAIVGFFLWRYAGFSKFEDRWLNAAGSFVLGVAIFPMVLDGRSDFNPFVWIGLPQLSPHGVSAVLAFLCIAVIIVWYSDSTLLELEHADPAAYRWFKNVYRAIAIFMVASIGFAVIMNIFYRGSWILFAEAFGIWAFGAYWFVKNWELNEVRKIMKGRGMKDEGKGASMAPSGTGRTKIDISDAI
jgi:hypothetical protein